MHANLCIFAIKAVYFEKFSLHVGGICSYNLWLKAASTGFESVAQSGRATAF